jgi:hypothetical protein
MKKAVEAVSATHGLLQGLQHALQGLQHFVHVESVARVATNGLLSRQ